MAVSVNPRIPRQGMIRLLKGSLTDRILLLFSLAGIAAAWFIVQAVVASGPAVAEIYHGKTLLATYPLPKAGEAPNSFQIDGELGPSEILLDEDGVRWIVDYKTSSPGEGRNSDYFVRQELERYQGQLNIYRELVAQLYPEGQIRTALYFPLFDGWVELDL